MGLAYLFALVVGFGILLVQSVMGMSKDLGGGADAHGDVASTEAHVDAGVDAHADADSGDVHGVLGADGQMHVDTQVDLHADVHADVSGHGGHEAHVAPSSVAQAKDAHFGEGFVALFLSTRFWIFAFLGFGLTGSILSYLFSSVSGLATLVTAVLAGVGSGLSASLAFRALRDTASAPAPNASAAVGRVARVLVPLTKEGVGQVRIDLGGQTVDLMAKTSELRIERGESVVIEEVDGEIAQVSKAPAEIER
jgi:membrane protein implicated in regulation of membrane protease activity